MPRGIIRLMAIMGMMMTSIAFAHDKATPNGATSQKKITQRTPWQSETNGVRGLQIPTASIQVKKAVFNVEFNPQSSQDYTVAAITIPQSGITWVGPEMDFYVMIKSNIIGGTVSKYGVINWEDSLIKSSQPLSMDALTQRFQAEINPSKLFTPSGSKDTDLRPVLPPGFLNRRGPSDSEFVKPTITGIAFQKSVLKLRLENPYTHQKDTIWINMKTQQVERAAADSTK